MDNIKEFGTGKSVEFPVLDEILTRINDLLLEYAGEVSATNILGILEIAKSTVIIDYYKGETK